MPDGQMQYFILPLVYESKEEEVRIDFTFRSEFTTDSLVTTNFSIYSDEEISNLKQVTLHHAEGTSELINIDKLFSEPSGNSRKHRYTSKLYFSDMLPLFSDPEQTSIEITEGNGSFIVHASRKTQKKLGQLKEQISILH